jgi:hypothetical protein
MRELARIPGRFHGVVSLWQSFGYFDDATNARVLAGMVEKLNPGGRLILDVYHRGFFERHQGERAFQKGGMAVTERKRLSGDRLSVELDYGPGRRPDVFEWQLYTPEQICGLGETLGLRPLVVCAGFDEHVQPSADGPRMQLVFAQT